MSLLRRARQGSAVPAFGGVPGSTFGTARGPSYADVGTDQGAGMAISQFLSDVGRRFTGDAAEQRLKHSLDAAGTEGMTAGADLARQVGSALADAKPGDQISFPAINLRRDDTDQGDAYDKALATAYLTNMDTQAEAHALKLAGEHPDDPQAFKTRWDAAGAALLKQLPEDMRPAAEGEWQRKGLRQLAVITEAGRQKSLAEANATLVTAGENYRTNAMNAWRTNNQTAIEEWDAKVRQTIDARTDLDPRRKAQILAEYEGEARAQSVLGHFDAAKRGGLGTAETFIKAFEDPKTHPALDPAARDTLARHMRADLAGLKAERAVALAGVRDDAHTAEEALRMGRQYPALDQLRARARAVGDVDTLSRLDNAQSIARDVAGFAKMSIVDQQAEISRRSQTVKDDSDNRRLDEYQRIAVATRQGVQADTLAFADMVGARKVAPLDLSNPKAMAASLAARVEDAKWAEQFYGVPSVSPLKKAEVDGMKAALDTMTVNDKAVALGAMAGSLGTKRLPPVLQQLHAVAPEFAHAGAIAMQGDMGTAADILLGDDVRRAMGKSEGGAPKMYLPTGPGSVDTMRASLISAMPDDAFKGLDPAVRAGIQDTVISLYAAASYKAGDANQLTVNTDRLNDAVKRMTGGILEHRGGHLLAPVRGMSQDDFDTLMKGLTDEDIGKPTNMAGTPVSAADLKKYGKLVSVGNGRYAVMIGDRALADPATMSDPMLRGRYVLDLGAIAQRKGTGKGGN